MLTCNAPDCGKQQHARGLCRTHYGRAMRTGTPPPTQLEPAPIFCTVPGCEKKTQYRGKHCPMHMMRLHRTGTLDARQYINKSTCTGPECSRRARSKGLCEGHASQFRRGAALRPIGKPKVSYQVGRPKLRGETGGKYPDRMSARDNYERCSCGLMLPCEDHETTTLEWHATRRDGAAGGEL